MNARAWRLISAILVAGTAAFVGLGYRVWQTPQPPPEERRVIPWNPQVTFGESSPESTVADSEFAETFARPLFSPTRKPFVPVAVAVEEPQPEAPPEAPVMETTAVQFDPGQFVLKGILADGQDRRALIATPDQPDGEWRAVGSELSGWIVKEIGKNAIIVSSGEKRVTVQQYVDNLKVPLGMPPPNQ